MSTQLAQAARPEIGPAAAAYLQLGLEALRAGDDVRALGAFASIDTAAWDAVLNRFPTLPDLIQKWEATR